MNVRQAKSLLKRVRAAMLPAMDVLAIAEHEAEHGRPPKIDDRLLEIANNLRAAAAVLSNEHHWRLSKRTRAAVKKEMPGPPGSRQYTCQECGWLDLEAQMAASEAP